MREERVSAASASAYDPAAAPGQIEVWRFADPVGSGLRARLLRYAVSVAGLAIPMAITVALNGHPDLNPIISAAFVITVSAAAWWAGAWAGVLVTCCSIPALTLAATNGKVWLPAHIDFVGLPILWFISFLVGSVANTRRKIEQVLREHNAELDSKVRERTADVETANRVIKDRLAEVELLYAQLPVGLAFLDAQLRLVRINSKLAAINGVPVADQLGRPLQDVLSPNVAEIVEPLYRKVLTTGEPLIDFELSYPSGDASNESKTWLVDCCPAKADGGSVLGVQVIVQDITERKRSEQLLLHAHAELAKREQEFRTVVNAIPQICWVSNPEGSVAWYNDRWYEYTGMQNGETPPGGWEQYVSAEILPQLRLKWNESISRREGFEMEFPFGQKPANSGGF